MLTDRGINVDRELAILGWSQAELARKLGVTPAAVTSWRKRGLPLTVTKYLEAMVKIRELEDAAGSFTARTPRAKRVARSEAWERSATDAGQQIQTEVTPRTKLIEWEDADLDQSEGWGEG